MSEFAAPEGLRLLMFVVEAVVWISNPSTAPDDESLLLEPPSFSRFLACLAATAACPYKGFMKSFVYPSFLTAGDLCLQCGQVVVTTDPQISLCKSSSARCEVVVQTRSTLPSLTSLKIALRSSSNPSFFSLIEFSILVMKFGMSIISTFNLNFGLNYLPYFSMLCLKAAIFLTSPSPDSGNKEISLAAYNK